MFSKPPLQWSISAACAVRATAHIATVRRITVVIRFIAYYSLGFVSFILPVYDPRDSFRQQEGRREAQSPVGTPVGFLGVVAGAELEGNGVLAELQQLLHGPVERHRPQGSQ